MADNPSDVGQLSASQQEALHQYMQVTNQDVRDSISLLRRSEWNAQIAITKFFDGEAPDPLAEALAAQEAPRPSARHENLQESLNGPAAQPLTGRRDRTDAAPRVVPLPPYIQRIPWILGLLLAPLGWGWHAASGLLRTISYILQFLPAPFRPRVVTTRLAGGLGSTTGRRMLMPRDAAARFKREFDEEYGPNELAFFEGGIAQAHDLAKKELKFLLVLIMSPEHDDTEAFVRGTLLAPEVVAFLNEPANRIVLWGGNVLDSEAYQAATEYACTKFPFSALVCLTPREGSTRMGIVKRLVGPMAAGAYLSELQNSLDKYGADLDGVRAERASHEAARSIRSQQDSAYERSLAIDRARAQERREAAAAAAAAEKRALEEAERAALREERRQQWRRWRTGRVESEPAIGDKSAVRVALKMPEDSGAGRIVRRFRQDAPVEELYAFVECYDLLQGEPRPAGQQEEEEEEEEEEKPEDYEHEFGFRIVSILPRVVYEPSKTATMMETVGRSGNLIVEEVFSDSEDEGGAEEA